MCSLLRQLSICRGYEFVSGENRQDILSGLQGHLNGPKPLSWGVVEIALGRCVPHGAGKGPCQEPCVCCSAGLGWNGGGEGLGVCTMLRMLIQPPCMKCTIFLQQTAESSCTPWAFGTPGVPIWYHPHLDLQTDCGPRHPRRTPRAASLAPSIHRCKRWNPETRGCGARPSRPEPAHGSASPLSLPVGRRSCCGWAPPPQPDGRPAGLAGGAGTAGRDRLAGRGPLAEAVRLLPSAAAVPHVCPLVKSAGRRCDYPASSLLAGGRSCDPASPVSSQIACDGTLGRGPMWDQQIEHL